MIPCTDCLILPLCKNKQCLDCQIITDYVYPVIDFATFDSDDEIKKKLMVVTKFFNKMATLYMHGYIKTIEFPKFRWNQERGEATIA